MVHSWPYVPSSFSRIHRRQFWHLHGLESRGPDCCLTGSEGRPRSCSPLQVDAVFLLERNVAFHAGGELSFEFLILMDPFGDVVGVVASIEARGDWLVLQRHSKSSLLEIAMISLSS